MRSKDLHIISETFNNLRLQRRSFVKNLLASTLALTVINPLEIFANHTKKVTIIGAGISGLSAAYYLKKQGIEADIYEASFRAGGRMLSYRNIFDENTSSDLGGEFIDRNHLDLLELAQELKVELYDLEKDDLTEIAIYIDGVFYSQNDLANALMPYFDKIQNDIKDLPEQFHYSDNEKFKHLDNLSVTEYLDKIEMKGWIRTFVETAVTTEYGCEASLQSSLNLLTILTNPEKNHEHYDIFGDGHEIYKYKGGAESLVEKLKARLENKIHLNSTLQKITQLNSGKIQLEFELAKGKQIIETDIVLLTVPFSVLRKMSLNFPMNAAKKSAINELGYSNARKFILGFENRNWRKLGFQGYAYSNTSILSGWDSTQSQNTVKGAYTIFLGGNGADNSLKLPENEVIQSNLNDLEKIFPNTKKEFNKKTLEFVWKDYPFALGAYSVYLKGQWSKFAGAEAEPCGNIFFAGEHTNIEFQGFMNGAVKSAKIAVKQIINKIK